VSVNFWRLSATGATSDFTLKIGEQMIRLLLLTALFYLGYTLIRSFLRTLPGHKGSPPPAKSSQGEEMVQDPHCGTYLPRGDALSKTVQGKKLYFCSSACRDAFTGRE
jgi:YHS domain-containing protein